MPEGDALFRTARTLDRALAGRTVTRFETVLPALARVHEDTPVTGRTVESVASAGKHLLLRLSGGLVLRSHLRMNGSWHLYRPGERWRRPRAAMRVVFGTPEFEAVGFDVPVAEFLTERDLVRQRDLRALGPDLLAPSFDADQAIARIRERGEEPIESVLLGQRVVAGIGNIFKSETLFVCRIHPLAPASSLSDDRLRELLSAARRLLQANVRADSGPGIVTYRSLRPTTGPAKFSDGHWVYGRAGRPCRTCGTPIVRAKTGPHTRTTYWCPQCQIA